MFATQTNALASLPARVAADEIFLVHAGGELDHLGRHVEERGIEAAEQRHRPFGEAGILEQQPVVLDQRQACLLRGQLGADRDDRAALGAVDDDVAGAQLLDIVTGRADRDPARMVEAVADGDATALHAGDSRPAPACRRAAR
jgi:hypothetical protein